MSADTASVVAEFWRRMNTNNWRHAAELFAEGFVLDWPQSRERIRGADDFAQLNAAYPATAPWQFETVSLTVEDTRAVTETRVTSADVDAIAISFFIVENGRITAMREFWPDPYPAPEWRRRWVELY